MGIVIPRTHNNRRGAFRRSDKWMVTQYLANSESVADETAAQAWIAEVVAELDKQDDAKAAAALAEFDEHKKSFEKNTKERER